MEEDFTAAEEVQSTLVAQRAVAERVARDSFRVGWVAGPCVIMLMEGLEGVVVPSEHRVVREAVEGTLGEAAEIMSTIRVGEVEDLTTRVAISTNTVATQTPGMVA